MGISYNPSSVVSGLVLALDAGNTKSYPGSGTTWSDLSGRGNNGTLTNGPTYSSANGGSIVFDGIDDYISFPANSIINSNADLTLNFWNKTSSLPNNNTSFTLLSGFSPSGYLQVRYATISSITSVQLVKSFVIDMGIFSGFVVSPNTSYLITITLNKSTNTWSLYVNGTYISSLISNQTFTTSAPTLGINYSGIEPFPGNMYSFSYYNRALSASEISQNFNALRGRYGI
jgi:hypothetical protein